MSGFFIIFWGFFKVNSGVFLHNRVATPSFTEKTSTVLALAVHCLRSRGRSGGAFGAIVPLKPTKVTLFTMISYNSEISIRDIRPICRI